MSSSANWGARSQTSPGVIARNHIHHKPNISIPSGFFLACFGLLLGSIALHSEVGRADGDVLAPFPQHQVRRDFRQENSLPGRVSLTSFWFINHGNRCTTGLDALAFLWLTTRFLFVCPYGAGRTALAVEFAPEIQWPSGESVSQTARPGLRVTHVHNTRLSENLEHVFRLSTKLAWEDSVQNSAPDLDKRRISQALLQDWSDLLDQTFQIGLLVRPTLESRLIWLVEFEQTLPPAIRDFNTVGSGALARWSRLGAEVKWRRGSWMLGGGLHYGNLSFDWLQISFIYPTATLAYDFGGLSEKG